MESSRQEYWSGLPFPSPGDLPDTGVEPMSPTLQVDALPSELPRKSIYVYMCMCVCVCIITLNINGLKVTAKRPGIAE